MTHREESSPWIAAFVSLGLAVAVSLLSGCASSRYEAAVQVESRGDGPVVVASFKLVN